MAASLRPQFTRLFTALHRLTAQPVCLTRPLCQVPPEKLEGAKEPISDKNDEANEDLSKSENAGTQKEDKELSHKTGHLAEEKAELKPSEASTDSSAKEYSAERKQNKTEKKPASQKKLHDLLSTLASADPIPAEPQVQLSRPKARKKAKRGEQKIPSSQPELELNPELVTATKEVAKSLGGDTEVTESELLSTLLLHSPETTVHSTPSLSELFVGMKVERKLKSETGVAPRSLPYDREGSHSSHSPQQQNTARSRRTYARPPPSSVPRTPVDLFGAQPLGIFSKETTPSKSPCQTSVLPTWDRLQAHELQQTISHPPSNVFVEMIQWTNEGKFWTFPIDNEIGLEEEKKVGFHEHVFLERHLEGWCPRRGPIRHFMELVCTGLSKNPHLTVERKKAHIEWYKNYFAEKEELLKELGAVESVQ